MTSDPLPRMRKRCPHCGEGVAISLADFLALLLNEIDTGSVVDALAARSDALKIGGSLMGKARTRAKKAAGRRNVRKARKAIKR